MKTQSKLQVVLCFSALALAQQTLTAAVVKPVIASAAFNTAATQITIGGSHFTPAAGAPSVQLGNNVLTVANWTDTEITATAPSRLVPATYLLKVNNGKITTFTVTFDPRFGINTSLAVPGFGAACTVGEVMLTAGVVANGIPANGQLIPITGNSPLFSLVGITYGGDGTSNFGVPDLRAMAPTGLTYTICDQGTFPSKR